MKILLILNDAPYGSEKVFNALRMAMALQGDEAAPEVTIALLGDSVNCCLPNQMTPQGYYNIERMLKSIMNKKGSIKTCSSCMQARGLMEVDTIEGIEMSTMPQLAKLVTEADKILTF